MMWKLVFLGTCSPSLATRVEGSSMLQVATHMDDREEYLTSMKQKVLEFAAAGVPANATGFLRTIKTALEDDVLPTIFHEKSLQENEHNSLFLAFGNVNTTYHTAMDTLEADVPGVTSAFQEHGDCRANESDAYTATLTCDGDEERAQTAYDTDESTVQERMTAAGLCVDADYAWRSSTHLASYSAGAGSYEAAIRSLIGTRRTLVDTIARCNGLDAALATQTAQCDGKQTRLEENACAYALGVQTAVGNYANEYEAAKTAFEEQFTTWQEQSADRSHQCGLVHTLTCYVQALIDHDDTVPLQNAVGVCDDDAHKATYDCDGVAFQHDTTPAAEEMASVPSAPCQDTFDYGIWPEGTTKGACATCAGIHADVTPAVPDTPTIRDPICNDYPGDGQYDVDFWRGECTQYNEAAKLSITFESCGTTDYFRGAAAFADICMVLTHRNRHHWSADGTNWIQPLFIFNPSGVLGGSDRGWPATVGDNRDSLPFWGGFEPMQPGGAKSGGRCCIADEECNWGDSWDRAFRLCGIFEA